MTQQQIVNAKQKRAAPARYVRKAHLGYLLRRFTRYQLAYGILDYVTDYVLRRVIDPARFADFWLVFDAGLLVGGYDDLAQESLVDAAEYVYGDEVEIISRVHVREAFSYLLEDSIINLKIGRIEQVMFLKDDAVIYLIQAARLGYEILPRGPPCSEVLYERLLLDQLVFEESHEDQTVKGALSDFRE